MNLFAKNIGNTERLAQLGAVLTFLELNLAKQLNKVKHCNLVTSYMRSIAPAYSVLGINTAGKSGAKSKEMNLRCLRNLVKILKVNFRKISGRSLDVCWITSGESIIVRSSSLLEDGFGNAFAGKYGVSLLCQCRRDGRTSGKI